MSPSVSTWATPSAPVRVKAAGSWSHSSTSATAASWAASIRSAIGSGAIAHSADTDFTGVNVRS